MTEPLVPLGAPDGNGARSRRHQISEQASLRNASWMSSRVFPADAEAAEAVQQRNRLLDHPPLGAQGRSRARCHGGRSRA